MSKADALFLIGIVEFFGKPREHCQRLLNALQTRHGLALALRGTNSVTCRRNQCFRPRVGLHHAEGAASMRPEKSLFNALLTHFLMGVALGLSLVLLLALSDTFHIRDLVAKSAAPVQTTVMLVTTYALMFGIGAALTGLVLTLEDES